MNKFEAIIFDKDGTLFDFQATWGAAVLHLIKQVAPDTLRAPAAEALGVDASTGTFRPDSVVIAGTTDDVASALATVTGRDRADLARIADRIGEGTPQVPAVDLKPCLKALSMGRVMGVATNDSEAPARAHLAAAGVGEFFDFVAGYDSGYGAKPAPGQLLAFARQTGIATGATIMVGDSLHDLKAARAAGMATVGVLTGIATRAELEPMADVVLPDIGHLQSWIEA